jgi:hypothetical protein
MNDLNISSNLVSTEKDVNPRHPQCKGFDFPEWALTTPYNKVLGPMGMIDVSAVSSVTQIEQIHATKYVYCRKQQSHKNKKLGHQGQEVEGIVLMHAYSL